jgi:uncharacterized protein (DUF1697 family)
MARTVVLLRGVNVGGRTLSMAALRDALTAAGCSDVVTYIQSGNVVLTLPSRPEGLEARWLEGVASDVAGYEVAVVTRAARELQSLIAANPYPEASGTALHVVFYGEAPPPALVDDLTMAHFAPEHATLVGRDLYLRLPNGMGRAKLPLAIDKAGRGMRPAAIGTARNWNTVVKLAQLAAP